MRFLRNLQNASNWNIGFCDYTPEMLIGTKTLPQVQWMEHSYKDRFFADPFILKVTDTEIEVLVEEYVFDNPPGLIVKLILDRDTKRLKQRYELLRLDTHLSYPAIIRHDGETFVYPENGASGRLNLYRYDAASHRLVEPVCILEEGVFDATIYQKNNGDCMLVATKLPDNLGKAYLYESASTTGPFKQAFELPIQTSRSCARMAGNFFEANGDLYRPAQDCVERYGSAISIMRYNLSTNQEELAFQLIAQGYKYCLGIHTINFHNGLCVIDGYGYMYPTLGRIYASKPFEVMRRLVKKILLRK